MNMNNNLLLLQNGMNNNSQRIAANNGCYTVYEANNIQPATLNIAPFIPSYIPTQTSTNYLNNTPFIPSNISTQTTTNALNINASSKQTKPVKNKKPKKEKKQNILDMNAEKFSLGTKGTSLSARY